MGNLIFVAMAVIFFTYLFTGVEFSGNLLNGEYKLANKVFLGFVILFYLPMVLAFILIFSILLVVCYLDKLLRRDKRKKIF